MPQQTSCSAAASSLNRRSGDVGAVYREIDPRRSNPIPASPGRCSTRRRCPNSSHSIREFGLMQPIVVRAVHRRSPARLATSS